MAKSPLFTDATPEQVVAINHWVASALGYDVSKWLNVPGRLYVTPDEVAKLLAYDAGSVEWELCRMGAHKWNTEASVTSNEDGFVTGPGARGE